jgi:tetratricopeptide (TPR) repeat protein
MPTAFCFYLTVALLAQWAKPLRSASRGWAWAAVPACAVFLIFAVQLFEGDRSLARVDRSLRAGAWNQAIDRYEHARRWLPWGVNADLWYSNRMAGAPRQTANFLEGVRAMQYGLQAAVRATERSEDRHNAWYNLAQFYADENDLSLTERSLRAASSWAPNWFKPHWMLARVLRLQGRVDDARAEAARAVDLDNGRDAEVLQTLRQLDVTAPVTKK